MSPIGTEVENSREKTISQANLSDASRTIQPFSAIVYQSADISLRGKPICVKLSRLRGVPAIADSGLDAEAIGRECEISVIPSGHEREEP
jgi:hypothetical protein